MAQQDSDGFVVVSKKKSCRKRIHKTDPDLGSLSLFDEETFLKKIVRLKGEVGNSEFFSSFAKTLRANLGDTSNSVSGIVCLGLGPVSRCRIAQYQLAFLLLISENFQCPAEVFDPIFNLDEKRALGRLSLTVSERNLEGKLKNINRTLYFLPHCPRELSNNLLYSNWACDQLSECFIISNSFEKSHLDVPERLWGRFHYLREIKPWVRELKIKNNFRFADIFNDLSLHVFPKEHLVNLDPTFWNNPEPSYSEETELIQT